MRYVVCVCLCLGLCVTSQYLGVFFGVKFPSSSNHFLRPWRGFLPPFFPPLPADDCAPPFLPPFLFLKLFFYLFLWATFSLTWSMTLPRRPPPWPFYLFMILSNSSSPRLSPRSLILFFKFWMEAIFSRFSACFDFILNSLMALWNFLFSVRYFFSSNVLILSCCLRRRAFTRPICSSVLSISAKKSSGRDMGTPDCTKNCMPCITLALVAL